METLGALGQSSSPPKEIEETVSQVPDSFVYLKLEKYYVKQELPKNASICKRLK